MNKIIYNSNDECWQYIIMNGIDEELLFNHIKNPEKYGMVFVFLNNKQDLEDFNEISDLIISQYITVYNWYCVEDCDGKFKVFDKPFADETKITYIKNYMDYNKERTMTYFAPSQ